MDMNQSINNLMKEAQKMQKRMQDAQDELSQLTITGESGGGMVKVKMNGRHDVLEVIVKPQFPEEEIEMMQDLFAAAVNDAVRKIEKASREKIGQLTAGLNIPSEFLKDSDDKE